MRPHPCFMAIVIGLVVSPSLTYAQAPASGKQGLMVEGSVARPLHLDLAELSAMPRKTVKAKDHDGKEAVFEGVALSDVLERAGVKGGVALRGEMLSHYLLVQAADGYRAVFALPELDPEFTDRVVLLADRRDGKALDDHEGPLRIVVPGEKRQARWVRQVTRLEVRHSQGDLHRQAHPTSSSR